MQDWGNNNPGDDIEKLNFPKMEKIVRLVYLNTWELANSDIKLTLEKSFR